MRVTAKVTMALILLVSLRSSMYLLLWLVSFEKNQFSTKNYSHFSKETNIYFFIQRRPIEDLKETNIFTPWSSMKIYIFINYLYILEFRVSEGKNQQKTNKSLT